MPTKPHVSICFLMLAAALAMGCVEAPPESDESGPNSVRTLEQEAAVPGLWNPSPATRAIAATQYVPVVDPPPVSPAGNCTSNNAFDCSCTHPACTNALPGTRALDEYIRNRWGHVGFGGLFCCRQNSATQSVPKLSVHAIGRAIDLMIPMDGNDADNGLGDPVADWLVENAEFIGVQRIVWDKAYWNGERGFGTLGSNSSPHVNHIHVELSIAGANAQTPFFTTGAVNGSCTAGCSGTRLTNEDCSTVDCAQTNTQCLAGPPPTCGTPPPPEPDAAEAVSGVSLPSITPTGGLGRFNFMAPLRIFDTRDNALSSDLERGDGSFTGPVTGEGVNTWTPSTSLYPADSITAWINLVALQSTEAGFFALAPAGGNEPATSSLNYGAGEVRANAAPAVLGAGDGIAIYSRVDAGAIADLTGVFRPTGDGMTVAGPTRLYDSRSSDAPMVVDEPRAIPLNAPAGTTGVVANIAVVGGDGPSHLVAHACDSAPPATSNINTSGERVVANAVIVPVTNDEFCITQRVNGGSHIIVDVTGFLSADGPLSYQPVQPRRLLDTRGEDTPWTNRLAHEQVIDLRVGDLAGMPDGVWAAAVNVVSVGANEPGFVTAHPCGGAVPNTSSLNFVPGGADAAFSVVPVGPQGKLCVYARSRTHLIVDLVGVWVHDENAVPPTPDPETDPEDNGDPDGPIDPPDNPDDMFADADEADVTTGTGSDATLGGGDLGTAPSSDVFSPVSDGTGTSTTAPGQDPGTGDVDTGCCRVRHRTPARDTGVPLALLGALGALVALRRRRR